jgi:hypothetical protein
MQVNDWDAMDSPRPIVSTERVDMAGLRDVGVRLAELTD